MTGVPPTGSGHSAEPESISVVSAETASVPNALAALPWHDMESAPRDGTIIAVCYREWNYPSNPLKVQFSQWIDVGSGGSWCKPYDVNMGTYADGWLSQDELASAMSAFGQDPVEGLEAKPASAGPQDDAHA